MVPRMGCVVKRTKENIHCENDMNFGFTSRTLRHGVGVPVDVGPLGVDTPFTETAHGVRRGVRVVFGAGTRTPTPEAGPEDSGSGPMENRDVVGGTEPRQTPRGHIGSSPV